MELLLFGLGACLIIYIGGLWAGKLDKRDERRRQERKERQEWLERQRQEWQQAQQ